MNKSLIKYSVRIYDFIIKFYPQRYRHEFGEEMKYVFSESLKEAQLANGIQGIFMTWLRTLLDAGKTIITQHAAYKKGGRIMKKSNDFLMLL